MTDRHSEESKKYRRWYNSSRWRKIREIKFAEQPLCVRCLAMGIVEEAEVLHHLVPHRGDEDKFWAGPFEQLCKPHHDSEGHREDLGQVIVSFDESGWPV